MHRASEDTQKRQRRDLGEPGQKMTPPFIGAKGDATSLNKRQLPKVAEIAPLLQIKRPTLSPLKRRLQNATCIADLSLRLNLGLLGFVDYEFCGFGCDVAHLGDDVA